MLTRDEVTARIAARKLEKGISWKQIAEVVGRSPVWTAAALSGQCQLSSHECEALVDLLDLTPEECRVLQTFPYRGALRETVPTDPFVYRFYEIMQVYGVAMKEVVQEEFGDGIMSAIDFTIDVERVPDPHGDRVKITYNGKFLPYKRF